MSIDELESERDLRDLADLFGLVWGRGDEPPISSDILRALTHSGNYVAAAREDGRLIGGIVGWLGMHAEGDLHMHSHILAVLPGLDAQGLGFALKQHQRTWCLHWGVKTIEWTFDPLVRRNAYFNLAKLGARAATYLVNFYGAMNDGINAGDESDRILVRWELESASAQAAAEGRPHIVEPQGAVPILDAGEEPVGREPDGEPRVMCLVPQDIVAVRRGTPELARRWRKALRGSLGSAMERGYTVAGFTREGWYVLARDAI